MASVHKYDDHLMDNFMWYNNTIEPYFICWQGAHIPTPPPVPEAIAQSIAANEAAQAAQNQGQQGQNGGAPLSDEFPSGPSNGYPSGRPTNSFAPQSDSPSGPGIGSGPSNQYIPPSNQPRPSGNGNFNPQSGYRY